MLVCVISWLFLSLKQIVLSSFQNALFLGKYLEETDIYMTNAVGGLVVTCLRLDPRFSVSNLAEDY
jgi:hypothetical protein